MGKVFVSYRRDDSNGHAGRIYDRLVARFGRDAVFMDVDGIPYGVDFRKHLNDAVSKCDVLLAIIGEDWLSISKSGKRRLDDPKDFLRIEVETALRGGIPLIPVLIQPAQMPQEEELPESLRDLAYRQAASIDPGRNFHSNMDSLMDAVDGLLRVDSYAKASADVQKLTLSLPLTGSIHENTSAICYYGHTEDREELKPCYCPGWEKSYVCPQCCHVNCKTLYPGMYGRCQAAGWPVWPPSAMDPSAANDT